MEDSPSPSDSKFLRVYICFSADESPETEVPPTLMTPTTPTAGIEKLATTPGGRSRTEREQRSGNTLYQELSFQDADALGEMDEGADITGITCIYITRGEEGEIFSS